MAIVHLKGANIWISDVISIANRLILFTAFNRTIFRLQMSTTITTKLLNSTAKFTNLALTKLPIFPHNVQEKTYLCQQQ